MTSYPKNYALPKILSLKRSTLRTFCLTKAFVLGWLLRTNLTKTSSSLKKFCLAVTHFKKIWIWISD